MTPMLKSHSSVRTPARTATPPMPQVAIHRASPIDQRSLLPAQPSSIPVEPGSGALLRPRLPIAPAVSPLESEADTIAAQVVSGATASKSQDAQPAEAPPILHEALGSPGHALDPGTRAVMQPRLGGDLGGVRIHTGFRAAEAADAIQAQAYTIGEDIFFGAGRYNPHSAEGRRLLAHELSHTVQQSGGGAGKGLSKAAPAVQRDPIPQTSAKGATQGTATDTDTKKPKTSQVTVPVPPALLSHFQLTPPSLLAPPQQPSYFPPPNQYTPPVSPTPLAPFSSPSPYLSPTPGGGSAAPTTAPKAPDRVSFHDFGLLSVGARIGFPNLSKDTKPGDPPSALQESLKRGEILNFMFTGQPPSEYSVDPSKLVGALWGIFSTQIDPSLAAKIAAGMASKPAGHGLTYQLDATILLNLGGAKPGGGGGATLTVNF
jgi:Domain of unknown function (DUF4157)